MSTHSSGPIPEGQQPQLTPPSTPPKIVPVDKHPETLPVSITQRIIHHYLSSPKVFEAKIGGVPSARKILDRTEAIFETIAARGGLTEDDVTQIEELTEESKKLQTRLDELKERDTKDVKILEARETCQEVLNIAQAALGELRDLSVSLERTEGNLQAFDEILETIEKSTFSQEYTGNVLQLDTTLLTAVDKIGHLDDMASTKMPGTATDTLMKERIEWGAQALAFAISEWEDVAIDSIRSQRDALLKAYKSPNSDQETKNKCIKLLSALESQLEALIAALGVAKGKASSYPLLEEKLFHAENELNGELNSLKNIVQKEGIKPPKAVMAYGSIEWKELSKPLLPPPPSPAKEPQEWSDRTKTGFRTLFSVLQLGQQAIEVGKTLEQRGSSTAKAADDTTESVGWFQGLAKKVGNAFKSYFGNGPLPTEQQQEKSTALQPISTRASKTNAMFNPVVMKTMKNALEDERLSEERKRSLAVLKTFLESPSRLPSGVVGPLEHHDRDKILYHIVLEHAGNVDLEGYNSPEMQSYILNLILEDIEALKSNPITIDEDIRNYCSTFLNLDKIDASLDALEKTQKAIEHSLKLGNALASEPFDKFYRLFTDDVERLQPEESFFFMTSWRLENSRHAVGYEVIRQDNGLYTFRIYNRGAGAEYHDMSSKDNYSLRMPFAEVVDVNLSSMTSPFFVGGLVNLSSGPQDSAGAWKPEDFYLQLMPLLGGKKNDRRYTSDHGMREIYQGVCTLSSQTAYLSTRSDLRTFDRRFITWKVKTLIDYHMRELPGLHRSEQARKLIRMSLEQISRDLVDVKKLNLFTDEEIVLINSHLESTEADLNNAESTYLKKLEDQAQIVSFSPSPILSIGDISLPPMPLIKSEKKSFSIEQGLPSLPSTLKGIENGTWHYNPATFVNDLESVLTDFDLWFNQYNNEYGYSADLFLQFEPIKRSLETFISKIPIEGPDVFWNNMSPVDAQKALQLIQNLSFGLFKSSIRSKAPPGALWDLVDMLDLHSYMANIKLLAITDLIAKNYKEAWGFEFPHLYQPSMDWFLFDKYLDAEIDDPEWKEQRLQLKEYWANVKTAEKITDDTPTFLSFESPRFHWREMRIFPQNPDSETELKESKIGDLMFATEWAKRPEIIEKMPREIANLPVRTRALYLLANGEDVKDWALPSQFFAVRNILRVLFYSNACDSIPLDSMSWKSAFPERLRLTPPNKEGYSQNWQLERFIALTDQNGASWPYLAERYKGPDNRLYHNPISKLLKGQESHQGNIKRLFFIERDLSGQGKRVFNMDEYGAYAEETRRVTPAFRLLIKTVSIPRFRYSDTKGEYGMKLRHPRAYDAPDSIQLSNNPLEVSSELPDELTQAVLSLRGNEAVQIRETLAFFMTNPTLLKAPEFRHLFKVLLNEDSLFMNEIKKNTPESAMLINELAGFLKDQSELASIIDDFDTVIDLADMNLKLSSQLNFVMEKYPGSPQTGFINPFFNSKAYIRDLLASDRLSETQQKNAHLILFVIPKNMVVLDPETAVDLMKTVLYFDIHGLPKFIDHTKSRKQFDYYSTTSRAAHMLQSAMGTPELRNQILNRAVKSLEPHFIETTWREAPSYPHYTTEDGKFTVDVKKGRIDYGSDTLRPFTFEGRNDPMIRSLIGDTPNVQASRDKNGVIKFLDLEGNECVYQDKTLLRRVGDKWFQAFDASILFSKIPVVNLLKKESVIWLERPAEGGRIKSDVIVPLEGSNNSDSCRIELEYGDRPEALRIHGIYRIDQDGNATGEVLADLQDSTSPYSFLDRFEERSRIRLWEDQETHEPLKLELPRYGLEFTFERRGDEYAAVCDKYPGFHIAKHQFVAELGDFANFVLLENDDGQKKVLMPIVNLLRPFAPLKTSSIIDFSSSLEADRLRFTSHNIKDGSIVPDNIEGRLHLALTFFWERRYSEAMKHLRGDESQLKPLSNEEKTLLTKIIDLDETNKDSSPEAVAIRMYAHYLLKRDVVDYGDGIYAPEMRLKKDGTTSQEEYLRFLTLKFFYREKSDQIGLLSLKNHEYDFLLGIRKSDGVSTRTVSKPQENLLSSAILEVTENKKIEELRKRLIPIDYSLAQDISSWWKTAQQGSAVPSFLRTNIARSFKEIFTVIRDDIYSPESAQLLRDITGYDLPVKDDPQAIKEAFKQLLNFNTNLNNIQKSIFSLILANVMEDPSRFKDIQMFDDPNNIDSLNPDIVSKILLRTAKYILSKLPAPPQESNIHSNTSPETTTNPISRTDSFPLNPEIKRAPPLTPMHQRSVSLQDSRKLEFTGVEDIGRFFKWVRSTPEGKLDELKDVFSQTTDDPIFNAMLKGTADQVAKVGAKRAMTRGHYELISMEKLHELKTLLNEKYDAHAQSAAFIKQGVLELANKPFDDPVLQAERESYIRGGYEKPFSIEELLHLFYTRDMEAIAKRNPALTLKEIESLFGEIKLLLEETKAAQHQQRMLKDILEIETNPEPSELQAVCDRLVLSMKANTQYLTNEHPEYLVLEVANNIIMRKEQVDVVETLFKGSAAIELEPSFGKTTTVQPTLARRDANGNNLVITVMPDPLMGSMAPVAQTTVSKAYGSKIETMVFDKSTKYDASFLQRIKDRLEYIKDNRETLYIVDGSIKSFYLSYLDTTLRSDIENPETIKVIKLFGEIFELFRNAAIVSLDEVDQILDPLKSHHFTFSEPQALHPQKRIASVAVFDYLLNHPATQKNIKLPFIQGIDAPPFTESRFKIEIKPLLIQGFLNGEMFPHDQEINSFLAKLTNEEKKLVESYLGENKSPEGSLFYNSIQSKAVKNTLAIVKEQINSILPLTLNKNVDEHFGPRPPDLKGSDDLTYLSIPYKGSNNPAINRDQQTGLPISNSEHGTDLELISYTTIMHLVKDLPDEIIMKEIVSLQGKAKKEVSKGHTRSIQTSKAYKQLKVLTGSTKDYDLLNPSPEEIREIAQAINSSPKIKLKLIDKYILSNVKSYEKELSCGGQIYSFLFNMVKGYSGTLWNSDAYPLMFQNIIKSETMAKTANILWENSPHTVRTFTPPQVKGTPEEQLDALVSALYLENEGFKGGFIDAGGYFREFEDNKLVAKAILEHTPPEFEGIDYFDQNGEVRFLPRGSNDGIPIALCTVPETKRTAYFDQIHTTGADLKLGASMTGTVSVSRHTIMRDITQAVGRLRGIDKGQRVDFIVGAEDLAVIRDDIKSLTNRDIGESLNLGDLLIFAIHMESKRNGDDNVRSLNSELEGVFRELHMELIADTTIPPSEKKAITVAMESLFVNSKPSEPSDEYGEILEPLPREVVIENAIDKWLNGPIMQTIERHPSLKERFPKTLIEAKLRHIAEVKLPLLPSTFAPSSAYDKEVLRMVETQLSTETNVETQTERMQETQTQMNFSKDTQRMKYTEPRPVFQWSLEHLFDWEAYQPAGFEIIKNSNYASISERHLPTVVAVSSVLGNDSLTNDYRDFFSPSILSSLNLMPIHLADNNEQLVYHPFGQYHDFLNWALFVQNTSTGEYKMILCNQDDAEQFMSLLKQDRNHPSTKERSAKTFLYHLGLDNGIVEQGHERVDAKQLENDPDFISLVTQGKFLKGGLYYNAQEKKALAKLIEDNGAEKMYGLFMNIILANRESIRSMYENSVIDEVFQTFIKPNNP